MFALFDLDDTIHDKRASLVDCSKAVYQAHLQDMDIGFEVFSKYFVEQNCIIQPKTTVFSNISDKFCIGFNIESKMLEQFDSSFHTFSKRFDGVTQTFEFLKREGVKMACVTNGRDYFQRNKINALGLSGYFDLIVTSGELGMRTIWKCDSPHKNPDSVDYILHSFSEFPKIWRNLTT